MRPQIALDDFRRQVERLRETYGRDAYPQPRVNLIWTACSHLTGVQFERLISGLIGRNQRPPMMDRIEDALQHLEEDLKREQVAKSRAEGPVEYGPIVSGIYPTFRERLQKLIANQNTDPEAKEELQAWITLHGVDHLQRILDGTAFQKKNAEPRRAAG